MRETKGELARAQILDTAVRLASELGIEGITIGGLAAQLGRSKSGLFAHFQSKERLQIETLERASEHFVDAVVKPALASSRGEPRLRALFGRWLGWAQKSTARSGCVFIAAAAELDDRPGPVRERLVEMERDWLDTLAKAAEIAVKEGHLRPRVEPEQLAFDLHAIMLGYHHAARLLRDPSAERRARQSFEALLAGARTKP